MNRTEAISVLKSISEVCHALDVYNIIIMPPNANDVRSKGNQLHIKAILDVATQQCIQPILDKYGMAMSQEKDMLVIYRPMKGSK